MSGGGNTGLMALPLAAYYAANSQANYQNAPTNALVDLSVAAAAVANQTIGALKLDGNLVNGAGLNLTLTGFTLNVASGALMTTGTSSNGGTTRNRFVGGTLNLPVETILFQNSVVNSEWSNINSSITGPGSLVVSGAGRLYLDSATAANTFTGGLVVNSGNQVLFNASGQTGTGTLTLTGGAISANAANVVISNPVNLNGFIQFGGNGNANPGFTLTGPITLTSNAVIDTTNSVGILNGAIGGSGTLTVASGGNALVLNNVNTNTGGFIQTGGLLQVGNNNALGALGNPVTLAGGTLQAGVGVTLPNNITVPAFASITLGNGALGQGLNLTFSGTVNLPGAATIAVTNVGMTTFSNTISGPGALVLTNAAGFVQLQGTNTYTGGTTVSAGTLILGNSSALGFGTANLGGATVVATAPVSFANSLLLTGTTTLNGAKSIAFTGTTTLLAAATLAVNDWAGATVGTITESDASLALTASGTGTLTLPNASSFTGGVTENFGNTAASTGSLGTLALGSNGAFGSGTATLNTGVLLANSALTIPNAIILQNIASTPLVLAGSNLTFNNTIAMSGAGAAQLLVNNTTTINGVVSGAHTFAMINSPIVATNTTGGTTTYLGGGNLILTAANNTFNIGTTIAGGTLTLSGAGQLSATTAVTVLTGGTLVLDNTAVNNNARILATATIALNGGTLQVNGNATTALAESLSAITLASGDSTIITNPGAAGSTLTIASLTRAAGSGATLNIAAPAAAPLGGTTPNNLVKFTAQPTPALTGLVLPYVTVNGTELASYTGTTNVSVAAYSTISGQTYAAAVNGAAATANVLVNGGTKPTDTLTGGVSETINSLTIQGSVTLTIPSGQTLTVTSGTVFANAGATLTVTGGGTLALGAEGYLIASGNTATASAGSLIINDTISGTNLTVGSTLASGTTATAGGVTLGAANSYTGSTSLSGAGLTVAVATAVPAASPLNLVSGSLQANVPATFTGAVTFNNSIVTFAGVNPLVFNGTVNLNGTADLITVANTGGVTFGAQVTGTGTLGLQGPNTLTLANTLGATSTFTGLVAVLSGILNTNATGLNLASTSQVTVANGGTLQLQTGMTASTLTRPLFLDGSGALPVINLGGTIATGSFTLLVNGVATGSISATLTGSALAAAIQAQLNLLPGGGGASVTASGSTITINIFGSAVSGTPVVSLNETGVTGGSITYGNGALENVSGNNTLGGAITLATPATIAVDANNLAQSVAIGGQGDLTKIGSGTLALNQANTYTGQTNINAGVVTINTNAGALGSIVSGTVVNSGATLQTLAAAGVYATETLTLNGTGVPALNNAGAFLTATASTILPGNLVVNTGSAIGVASGSTLTLDGVVSGSDLTVLGGGTLTLATRTLNTGITTVNGSTLNFSGSGSVANSSSIVINPGATFTVDNSGGNVNLADRIGDSTGLTLNGGTFNYLGASGVGVAGLTSTERLGTIMIGAGQSTIATTSGPANSAVQLTSTSLTRNAGGTVSFVGLSGTTPNLDTVANKITFIMAPTTVGNNGGILPYAVANGTAVGSDFATYDMANNSIAVFSGYVGSIAAAGTGDIVKLTQVDNTLTAPTKSITGLLLAGGTLSEGGNTLTLSSGGLVGANGTSSTIIGGSLAFGSTEGIITISQAAILTINSTITGTYANGVTIASDGNTVNGTVVGNSLQITQNGVSGGILNLPTANTYTGPTNLDSGAVIVGNALSLSTGALNVTGGTIAASTAMTLTNAINLTGGSGGSATNVGGTLTVNGNTPITLSGAITLSGFNAINVGNTGGTTVTNNIGGTGLLTLGGAGTLFLPNAITDTNTTILNGATVVAGTNSSFGSGLLVLTGGALMTNNASGITIANPVELNGSVMFTGTNPIALTGAVTMIANSTVIAANAASDRRQHHRSRRGSLSDRGRGGHLDPQRHQHVHRRHQLGCPRPPLA